MDPGRLQLLKREDNQLLAGFLFPLEVIEASYNWIIEKQIVSNVIVRSYEVCRQRVLQRLEMLLVLRLIQ